MTTTPEIKTKFTLEGLENATARLRSFGRSFGLVMLGVHKDTTAFKNPFKGLDLSLRNIENHARAKEVAKVGAKAAFTGIKIGALGAAVSVGALALKFAALSKVAVDSAKETAASLKQIGLDADKIGASPQDVNVLGFAGERSGVDRDEIINQISTISNEFLTVRDNIGKANSAYQSFLGMQAKQAALGARVGGAAGFGSVLSGFSEADLQARTQSITAIEARLQQIDEYQNRISVERPHYGGIDPDTLSQAGNLALDRERQQLLAAQSQYKQGLSPQGQALTELQGFGIDFDRASKGGVDGLVAISEAFQRIQDPAQKARVAMRLFGEDAGTKMIPLLNGGKKAIDEYRETLKRLGGEVTAEDVEKAKAYENAVQDMQTAIGGIRLEIARNLLPYLTETSVQLTNWFVKSRVAIAKYATGAFLDLRQFTTDIISIIGGDTDDIKTKWLDSLVKKSAELVPLWNAIKATWSDAIKQVSLLWNGKDADYAWLNTLRDGAISVKNVIMDVWAQIVHLVKGENTDYAWLNKLRDGVVWFSSHLADAFALFRKTMSTIADVVNPILKIFHTDLTTTLLFVGMLRFSGLLGKVALSLVGLKRWALGSSVATETTAASVAGGAAAEAATVQSSAAIAAAATEAKVASRAATEGVKGIGTAATGAVPKIRSLGSSFAAVGKTAAGSLANAAKAVLGSVGGIKLGVDGILNALLLLPVVATTTYTLGQQFAAWMLKDVEAATDKVISAQARLMAVQGNNALYERLGMRDDSVRTKGAQKLVYGDQMGIQAPDPTYYMTAAQKAQYSKELMNGFMGWDKNYDGGDLGALARESEARRGAVSKRVAVDINVNGRPTTLYGDDVSSTQLTRDLEYANRSY
ncbi:hypothetical protein [Rhizobium sp. BK456]|uniref:hypothetical protein n=1 Tax=Rhizobium sp. BK456 TaxID=2587007 RepID=UPI00161BA928|nr:hypothetical protein [Rhizobium sp. BK456]MBB3521004.1 hypothetical protein [Rhizobium sp. BK456]